MAASLGLIAAGALMVLARGRIISLNHRSYRWWCEHPRVLSAVYFVIGATMAAGALILLRYAPQGAGPVGVMAAVFLLGNRFAVRLQLSWFRQAMADRNQAFEELWVAAVGGMLILMGCLLAVGHPSPG